MNALMEYLSSLVIVAAVAGLISIFSPIKGGTMKKYVNYAVALSVVLVVLSPLKSFIKVVASLDELLVIENRNKDNTYDDAQDKTNQWIIEKSQDTIKEGLKTLLQDRFNIQREEVDINLVIDSSNKTAVVIKKIEIKLTGYAMWTNAGEIESYISGLVGCDSEVISG